MRFGEETRTLRPKRMGDIPNTIEILLSLSAMLPRPKIPEGWGWTGWMVIDSVAELPSLRGYITTLPTWGPGAYRQVVELKIPDLEANPDTNVRIALAENMLEVAVLSLREHAS